MDRFRSNQMNSTINLLRVGVRELIPERNYYVIVNYAKNNKKLLPPLEFEGTYDFSFLYMPPENPIAVFTDAIDNSEKYVVGDDRNEFYLMPPPPMNKGLKTQIQRNTLMHSNAAKTIPLIDTVIRQNTNNRPKIPSILSKVINEFGGSGGVKIRRRKSRKSRKLPKSRKSRKSRKNTKRISI
jgi:hypothetical protein